MQGAEEKGETPYDVVEDLLNQGGIVVGEETTLIFTKEDPHKVLLAWIKEHNPLNIFTVVLGKVSVGADLGFDGKRLYVFVVKLHEEVV